MIRILICWFTLIAGGMASPHAIAIWRAGSGLPHQNVRAITQTSDGCIWVGTADGLARFDGAHFTVYRSDTVRDLGTARIERLAAGASGRLWIGTADRILLKHEGGIFTRVLDRGEPLLAAGFEILTEDRQGSLWITTLGGRILRLEDGKPRDMSAVWKTGGQLRLDGDGQPVVNTPSALFRLRGDTLEPIAGQPTGVTRYLAPGYGGFWMEQGGQVRRWKEGQGFEVAASPRWGARDLTFGIEDHRHQLWLATSGQGLLCYGPDGSVHSLDTTSGFAGDFVQALFEDRDGNVWVGTAGGGLGRISPAWFQVFGKSQGLSSDRATAVCQDGTGTIWVGTAGDGINRIDANGAPSPGEFPQFARRTISTLSAGPDGVVWAGFGDGGLQKWQDGKWSPAGGWPEAGAAVQALLLDRNGSLWVGQKTRNRLARIASDRVVVLDLPNPVAVADVRAFAQDRDGSIWIGTDGSGLFRHRDGAFTRYSIHDGLPSDSIWSLLACDDGSLWIGTAGEGIARWKDGRFATCGKEQGLPESVICAIRNDHQGGIWLTGYQGLFRLDRGSLEDSFEKGTRVAPVVFGRADGLPELQGVSSGSPSLLTPEGRLWFATTAGAVTVDPKDRVREAMPPPVFIDSLVVDGVAMDPAGPLSIPAGRYDFFSTNATRRACYTSNSTESGSDAVRTIALDLSDLNNTTVEGHGATLMMRGKMTMLVAERCSGLTLNNLTFDFARPTVSEFTAIEKQSTYWVARVHPQSTYQITGGNRVLWTGEDWSTYHNMVQHYDPATLTTWRGGDPTASATAVTDLGNGTLRFDVPSGSLANVVVGRTYQVRNTTRDQVGMWFNRGSNLTVQDVKVRSMHGFGMLFQFMDGVGLKRIEVAPPSGSGRTCASAADILHFSGCKGLVSITDSKLTAAQDDALNIHGTHLRIVSQPAANQVRVRFMHAQSWGFQAFIPGDQIEFVRKDTLLSYGSASVTVVAMTSDPREQILTLDANAPAGVVLNSDAVENVTWTPSVEVLNCDIAQIPTRGFLLTSRRPTLIQGNRFFRTQNPAILVEDDAAGWYESGPVRDLTLRGNSFYECGENVVQLDPQNTTHSGAVHSNLRVRDNIFTLKGTGGVRTKSTDTVSISANRFRLNNGTSPAASSLVSTTNTTNLAIGVNTTEPSSAPAIRVTNGDFETTTGNTVVPGWFSSSTTGPVILNDPSGTGHLAKLPAGTAIYQEIGPTDPAKPNHFQWTLSQRALSGQTGALQVSIHVWDARFTAADGSDISVIPPLYQITIPASSDGLPHTRGGDVDLSSLPVGSRVWLRIAAPLADAAVDAINGTMGAAPDTSHYASWAFASGLFDADTAPMADPDQDGLPNLLEYLLEDYEPTITDPAPFIITYDTLTGLPLYGYRPRATQDAELIPEYQSGSLDGIWHTVVNGVAGLTLTTDGTGTRWIGVTAQADSKSFLRLRGAFLPYPAPVVQNPGFELPDQTGLSPAYSSSSPSGWTFASPVNGGVEEIRDNRFGTSGPEGTRLTGLGGQGDQVGYINLGSSGTATASATSASPGNVAPNTTYTLTIAFAQRASGDRHPNGNFGLLVNGTFVGTFTTITGQSLTTGFNNLTYTWTSPGPGDPMIGQPLQIRMNFTYSTAAGGWQQAQFDNVRLTASAAP
ncbi:right-handed parallel beta-helix repeat-containing protein [Luteolibacter ambystomatis]|uniref:Right-handed parallel beta-helix repeat-containing protein n=1 Tax=Luteolibacter ambystomatis TaxID=2824561 RepID=A0A975PGS2_9BACT|nr:two-component regulator propeller domain-containing protein [Luteolibacter ambystomatis]QUE53018.1 right-handed parallel beta-helix repeat-containing protein [Luteolibacter ambystomatis]